MAPVIVAAAIPLLAQGAQMIAANQTSQAAKGKATDALNQEKAQTFDAESADSKTAAVARTRALGAAAAGGQASTILTGPRGAPPSTTPRKTLLGL